MPDEDLVLRCFLKGGWFSSDVEAVLTAYRSDAEVDVMVIGMTGIAYVKSDEDENAEDDEDRDGMDDDEDEEDGLELMLSLGVETTMLALTTKLMVTMDVEPDSPSFQRDSP